MVEFPGGREKRRSPARPSLLSPLSTLGSLEPGGPEDGWPALLADAASRSFRGWRQVRLQAGELGAWAE